MKSVTYPFLAYSVSSADTLCDAVTLNFDPLILNVYDVWLSCSNHVANLSESSKPRWSYNDLNITNLVALCHLGFDWKWIFKDSDAFADSNYIHVPNFSKNPTASS